MMMMMMMILILILIMIKENNKLYTNKKKKAIKQAVLAIKWKVQTYQSWMFKHQTWKLQVHPF